MRRLRGQALVETALVTPVLLLFVVGLLGVTRATQAQMGVNAVSREVARAAALADSGTEAAAAGVRRGQAVAAGYGLTNGSLALAVDASGFARGGQVRASVGYAVSLADLPLLGWARYRAASSHVERVDPYRSFAPGTRS